RRRRTPSRDGPAGQIVSPGDVAQPAAPVRSLRAAARRNQGDAAVRRRFSSRPQPGQSDATRRGVRGAGGEEPAPGTTAVELTGEHAGAGPADHVWKALTDPEKLKSCIPGCDSIEPDGDNAYRMAMAARVGPVSARFSGKMRMSDIDAEHGYTLRFEGTGGA